MFDFNGLKCTDCGGELELCVSFDGCSEEALEYNGYKEWEWLVHLDCCECSRVYPIGRVADCSKFSLIRDVD